MTFAFGEGAISLFLCNGGSLNLIFVEGKVWVLHLIYMVTIIIKKIFSGVLMGFFGYVFCVDGFFF